MEKKDYLHYCRYYKGEEESPYEGKDQNKDMLWFYERCWIIDITSKKGIESSYLSEYLGCGLGNLSEYDGVPITLKAFLFNRYAKSSYSMMDAAKDFREFYKEYYGTQGE